MSLAIALDLLGVFFAGLLAGTEITVHYGVRAPAKALDAHSQLQLRHGLVTRLRILVPAFFIPTAVFSIAGTALDPSPPGVWLRLAGLLALAVWVAIRVIGTVPINSATLSWQLNAPPENWKAQVERAERFHDVGVAAAVFAFGCFLLAASISAGAP
jgi:hypothetical protein